MERRKAVLAAATAALTLLAGAAAISLNTSLVSASGDDGVGQVSPVDPATTGTVDVEDPAAGPVTSSRPSRDDELRDDESDDGHHDDDASVFEEHEYEGADDDD